MNTDANNSTTDSTSEQSIPKTATPIEIRDEFQNLVINDLLGPRGGDTEEFEGVSRVRDRYLVGMLAPQNTIMVDPARSDESKDDPSVAGAREFDQEDGLAPLTPSLSPSSLGLSFVVDFEVTEINVVVRWGKYEKCQSEEGNLLWRRSQVEVTKDIKLSEGTEGSIDVSREHPAIDLKCLVKVHGQDQGKLVSLFLTNRQLEPKQNKDEAWMFQVSMVVSARDGSSIFVDRSAVLDGFFDNDSLAQFQDSSLEMQYRNKVEFAKGHGTSVHVEVDPLNPKRAKTIRTTAVPTYEVPLVEAPSAKSFFGDPLIGSYLGELITDMKALSELSGDELVSKLSPLGHAYERWIGEQENRLKKADDGLDGYQREGAKAIASAKGTLRRIRYGIELLAPVNGVESAAAEAFRFANHAMYQQRIRSLLIARRANEAATDIDAALLELDTPENHSWRLFQLAFILLNLEPLCNPMSDERSDDSALADLLFFPTGGGKTEAYLGLAAFTLAIRRLQGIVHGYDGRGAGIAVLMRYTLRLLTAQQFERAASLIAACEVIRRDLYKINKIWGEEPFRLGLWVGSTVSPNSTAAAQISIENARGISGGSYGSSPLRLSRCPWCGEQLRENRDIDGHNVLARTLTFCSDSLGRCPFTRSQSRNEGIPVITVDEEVYRLLPSFIIATVDKFAQLPLKGELHLLFGKAQKRCERHGFRSNDLINVGDTKESDSHRPKDGFPASTTRDLDIFLRPPDLIIQDELHLITGPLGTMVALYEAAIDDLCSYEIDGKKYRAKVIASTATIKQADQQVRAIFDRRLTIFPPPMFDAGDSFFAKEQPISERAGRRYIGICAPGTRLKEAEVRLFSVLLSAGAVIYKKYGAMADPWMTLVGYFSALRELAGARRLVDDQIKSMAFRANSRNLESRSIGTDQIAELTSRVSSAEILKYLTKLSNKFEDDESAKEAIAIVLATNMIAVGVDVPRLGLMCVVGQPKATSEYIQATSRVGRSQKGPGLVFTLFNWSRPRDMSYFETFEHFHATFYKQVEPLSVTPFSERAIDRGLSAVLVGLMRHQYALDHGNSNSSASFIAKDEKQITNAITKASNSIYQRSMRITKSSEVGNLVSEAIDTRITAWREKSGDIETGQLGYRADPKLGTSPLLSDPEPGKWDLFTVQWSLRETEPDIELVLLEGETRRNRLPKFEMNNGVADPFDVSTTEDGDESIGSNEMVAVDEQ